MCFNSSESEGPFNIKQTTNTLKSSKISKKYRYHEDGSTLVKVNKHLGLPCVCRTYVSHFLSFLSGSFTERSLRTITVPSLN